MVQHDDVASLFQLLNDNRTYLNKWLPLVRFTLKEEDSFHYIKLLLKHPLFNTLPLFALRNVDIIIGLIGYKDTARGNQKSKI